MLNSKRGRAAEPQEGTRGAMSICLYGRMTSGESHRPQESNCMTFLKGHNHRKGQTMSSITDLGDRRTEEEVESTVDRDL